jgi:uncharacterized protein
LTRDRDPAGRPRNARPRDGLGRPLDRSAAETGPAPMPDDLAITGRDAVALADGLLREGRPFHAHEVLEAAWKSSPPGERDLWQGLAQIAVGLTHARRGNARGAVTLLRRGAQRVRAHQGQPEPPEPEREQPEPPGPEREQPEPPGPEREQPEPPEPEREQPEPPEPEREQPEPPEPERDHPYGMDIPAVLAAADDLAARIERHGLDAVPAADLTPRLLALP